MSKLQRNEPCPCGSGKKFKKCCIDHYQKEPMNHHSCQDPECDAHHDNTNSAGYFSEQTD